MIFTLIFLIIFFCEIDFFSPSLILRRLICWRLNFLVFFYLWCFWSNDMGHEFEKLIQFGIFFFSYFFLWFYHSTLLFFLNIILWLSSIFFSIGLSWSQNIDHKFCRPFLNKDFFKKIFYLYLILEEFLFYFIHMSFIL